MHKYLVDALPPMCHLSYMYLTVLLALQRFISITYPIESRTWFKTSRVKYSTAVAVFFSIIFLSPKLFDLVGDASASR